jgi:methyl-accepting chemotaxis protein
MFKKFKLQWKMVILISMTGIVVLDLAVAAYSLILADTVRDQVKAHLVAETQAVAHTVSVVAVDVTLDRLDEIIAGVKFGEAGHAFVVDSNTRYVVHPSAPEMVRGRRTLFDLADETGDESARMIAEAIEAGEGGFTEWDNPLTDDKDWVVYVPVASTDWWLLLTVPIKELVPDMGRLVTLAVIISLTGLAALAVMAFVVARSVVRPIESLVGVAQAIASGDLGGHADIKSGDEIGMLADAFNQMIFQLRDMLRNEQEQREYLQVMVREYGDYMAQVAQGNLAARLTLYEDGGRDDPLVVLGRNLNETVASLQRMIRQMRDAANNLSSAAAEILSATTQQASGAHEQSAAIAQTTTTVDELKTIAEQSVRRAQEVANASQRTVEVSHTGQQSVQDTIASMSEIKARVEGIAENILALSEQTQQIGEIIATVNDIAAQSNMLALNASVEAARAGEYGKGFAVVAVEVRNLAEQSRQATAQVKAILSDIQKATNATVMATEEGTKGVDEGVQKAAQAQEVIGQLSAVIEESAQASMQVVAGGRQQSAGIEQIALAMQSIGQATMQGLSSTRQAEKIARELNELARSLTEIVEQYQL